MYCNFTYYYCPTNGILSYELKRALVYHTKPDQYIKFMYHNRPFDIYHKDDYDTVLERILLSLGATL